MNRAAKRVGGAGVPRRAIKIAKRAPGGRRRKKGVPGARAAAERERDRTMRYAPFFAPSTAAVVEGAREQEGAAARAATASRRVHAHNCAGGGGGGGGLPPGERERREARQEATGQRAPKNVGNMFLCARVGAAAHKEQQKLSACVCAHVCVCFPRSKRCPSECVSKPCREKKTNQSATPWPVFFFTLSARGVNSSLALSLLKLTNQPK
jgi:hypothetical protein